MDNYIFDDSGKKINLTKLTREHLSRFNKFLINGEIWNVYLPKYLRNN